MKTAASEGSEALAPFLSPNRGVLVSGLVIDAIQRELRLADGTTTAMARAIHDYAIDPMEYKEVSVCWSNGDMFWAYSQRYGEWTAYRPLFLSLARAEGMPARFEIGFPTAEGRAVGSAPGNAVNDGIKEEEQ